MFYIIYCGLPPKAEHWTCSGLRFSRSRKMNLLRFIVQKHIAHLAACSAHPLVRDGPLAAPAFVKLAYLDDVSWSMEKIQKLLIFTRILYGNLASVTVLDASRAAARPGMQRGGTLSNDDVIKWKHFPRYWPFVRGIHRYPVNSPHKGQCRGALMFSLICVWINGWVNNREAGDLRRYYTHYDVTVMVLWKQCTRYTEIRIYFLNQN